MVRGHESRAREPQKESGTTKSTALRPTDPEPLTAGPTHDLQRNQTLGYWNIKFRTLGNLDNTYPKFWDKAVLWAEAKQSEDNKKGKGVAKGQGKPAETNKTKTQGENPTPQNPKEKRREKAREITTTIAGGANAFTTATDGTGTGHLEELHPLGGRTGIDTGG